MRNLEGGKDGDGQLFHLRRIMTFLLEHGFRIQQIADMFACSRKTVECHVNEYHITSRGYSNILDAQLDELVEDQCTLHPQCGEKSIEGTLQCMRVHVQRRRVRDSLRRMDPILELGGVCKEHSIVDRVQMHSGILIVTKSI